MQNSGSLVCEDLFCGNLSVCVCESVRQLQYWLSVWVCVCYLCLSLGSLSRGPGEQMAGRAKEEERQFRNGNRGMREGLIVRHTERTKEAEGNISEGGVGRLSPVLTAAIFMLDVKLYRQRIQTFSTFRAQFFFFCLSVSPACRLHIITSDISKSQPELTKKDRLKLNNSCREIKIIYHILIFDRISPQ